MNSSTVGQNAGKHGISIPAYAGTILFFCFFFQFNVAYAEILILVSDDKPTFTNVAKIIQSSATNVRIQHMRGDATLADELAILARESAARSVVAIGSLAAQAARRHLNNKTVIFCQVLNPEQFDLVTPWMKGIGALPSLERQFRAWRQISPELRRVGVVTGGQMFKLVEEARRAAEKTGITLEHEVVSSGREIPALIARKHGDIQGLWLAPDSTILSSEILHNIVSTAILNEIQILTFSPALLKEGALISATATDTEIAQLVLSRLRLAAQDNQIPGDSIIYPSDPKIQINSKVAEHFRLTIPAEWNYHAQQ